jgi:hypothetical protein
MSSHLPTGRWGEPSRNGKSYSKAKPPQANLRRGSADPAKSRADRFCRLPAIRAAGVVLRVRAGSRIARTRAVTYRFSDISENLETEWRSEQGLNFQPCFSSARRQQNVHSATS